MKRFASEKTKENIPFVSAFCGHLTAAAASSGIESIHNAKKKKSFLFLTECIRTIYNTWKDTPEAINKADTEVILRMLDFFAVNPPSLKKPYIYRLLNLYVPSVEAAYNDNGKSVIINASLTSEQIERRISDTNLHFNVLSLFYYYITGGNILMKCRFEIIDSRVTAVDENSPQKSIVTESITPYPSDLIYSSFRKFDGIMFFFPHYPPAAYLSGIKNTIFVPGFLNGTDRRMFSKMSTSASWRVLIHEVFHNFGQLGGIDAGHNFQEQNKNKWPEWYSELVKNNSGKISELAWYEKITSLRSTDDSFGFLKLRDSHWLPSQTAFKLAKKYSALTSTKSFNEATMLLNEAEKSEKSGKTGESINYLKKAAAAAPFHELAHFRLAYAVHWKEKNYKASIPYYENYLEKFSGFEHNDTVLIYLSSWYSTKNPGKALELIEKHGTNPAKPGVSKELRFMKAKLMIALKRTKEAVIILKSIASDHDDPARDKAVSLLLELKK